MSKQKAMVAKLQQGGLDLASQLKSNGFVSSVLKSGDDAETVVTKSYDNVLKALDASGESKDKFDEAKDLHKEHTGVIAHAIVSTINTASAIAPDLSPKVLRSMVEIALAQLETDADISTKKELANGGHNPRFRATYKTRKSEALSSLDYALPNSGETLGQFTKRANGLKKEPLETEVREIVVDVVHLIKSYKAGTGKPMPKDTQRKLIALLKPFRTEVTGKQANLDASAQAIADAS